MKFIDMSILPFPHHNRKPKVDKQFAHFLELIRKVHIKMPLIDAMQVPIYACYLKNFLNNKWPLPTTELVTLTEECNIAILKKLLEK